jgi:RHS repeat-associated protein
MNTMLNITQSFGRALIAALAFGFTCSAGFAAESHYYVNDPLATTVAIADSAGEIAAMEADAFGAPLAMGEALGRFTGKPYDADLGAFVFPFRNYRPEEGRWMSSDPSGFPDGVNASAYAPEIFTGVDPLGLAEYRGKEVMNVRSFSQNSDWTLSEFKVTNSSAAGLSTAVYGVSWEWIRSGSGSYIPTGGGANVGFSGTLHKIESLNSFPNYLYIVPTTNLLSIPSSSTWQGAIGDALGSVFTGVSTDSYGLSMASPASPVWVKVPAGQRIATD